MIIRKIYDFIDSIAPFTYQENWDNSGLQIGDLNNKVSKIILSLDVTLDMVLEAEKMGVNLIISHHPLFFKPLKFIDLSKKILKIIIKNNITVISNHTPLDMVPDGVSFSFAKKLNLNNLDVLVPLQNNNFYKLFFTIPTGMESSLLNKIFSEGVGEYLFYKDCAFETFGEGRFKKKNSDRKSYIENLSPYKEGKLEILVRKDRLEWVIEKLRQFHPYDELAFDVFEEKFTPLNIGYGVVGTLSKPKNLSEFIEDVKDILGISKVRFIGDLKKKVKKIAVMGGAGSSFIKDAIRVSADLFISGDIKYHDALEHGDKISILDVGHRASEEPVLFELKEKLSQEFGNLKFFVYKSFGDFFKYI